MIKAYPRFVGRLGNNLFQIAACIGYAKKHGVEWGIKKGYVERGFNAFQVDKFFPNLPGCDFNYPRHQEHKANYHCPIHGCGLDTCWFNYHEIPFHPNGVELAGFFQSWKYFDNAKEEVREAFKLPVWEQYKDYVSIHVRRGDYVDHSHAFPPVTREYILMAIGYLVLNKHIDFDTKVIFCSDDISWCKQTFNVDNPNYHFSEGHNEFEDLCIMASCKHNIISNSTLAWWGAWLNPNPDKVVVSPSSKPGNWFGHGGGVKIDIVDLLPPEWKQIEFR